MPVTTRTDTTWNEPRIEHIARTAYAGLHQLSGVGSIEIDGASVSFLHCGRGRPVLLIHGNSSCKEVFEHQTSFLASRGFHVIAADLPGHGASSASANPQSGYSFPGYARTLHSLMNSLGIFAYDIVGWSLGGHIGIEMWATIETVGALAITGTPPVRLSAAGAAEGFLPSDLMQLAGKPELSRDDAIAYGTAMLDGKFNPTSPVGRNIQRTDGRARIHMMRNGLAGVGVDQVQAVARCPKPLAILQGKYDPFVNLSHVSSLTYRNLWLKNPVFLDAGHAPHWTCSDTFNEFLGDFLSETY